VVIDGNDLSSTLKDIGGGVMRSWAPSQIVVMGSYPYDPQFGSLLTEIYGNPFYNVVVRDNSITGQGWIKPILYDGSYRYEGYYANGLIDHASSGSTLQPDTDPTHWSARGLIFDRNSSFNVPNAYSVGSYTAQTVIWNSIEDNFDMVVADETLKGLTHNSIDTVYGPHAPYGPAIIMDNTDATGVTITGAWTTRNSWRMDNEVSLPTNIRYYGRDWIDGGSSNDGSRKIRYTPTIPSTGDYDVYVRWVDGKYINTSTLPTTQARYTINHSGGTPTVDKNQRSAAAYPGQWSLLGTYKFDAGTTGYVELKNMKTDGSLRADAVMFMPKEKVFAAGMAGSGSGTGGVADIVASGGTATLTTPGSGSSITFVGTPTMNGGNYAHCIYGQNQTAPKIAITPASVDSSWQAMSKYVGGKWLLNGGFDFFFRANSNTNNVATARLINFDDTGAGGWKVLCEIKYGTTQSFKLNIGGTTGSFSVTQSTPFLKNGTVYHVAVTFNTDPATGIVTVRYFKRGDSGAIDTTTTTDQIYQGTWNPAAGSTITQPLRSTLWHLAGADGQSGPNYDIDMFRLYRAVPPELPANAP
jgi:hypothetical protein